MLGRLLGLSAILLQIAVFLQPLLPENRHVSSVCETIVQALHLQQSAVSAALPHANHHALSDAAHAGHAQHLEHAPEQQPQSPHHAHHDCQYCLVYSYALPLLDTKLSYVLIRVQAHLLAFSDSISPAFFKRGLLFFIPQGRAPPRLSIS